MTGADAFPVQQGNPGQQASAPAAPTNNPDGTKVENQAPGEQNSTARFRQLARIDRQNRERAKALKAQQAALAAQQQELAELRAARELAAENPIEAAQRLGISTDAYVQYLVKNPPAAAPDPIASDVAAIKDKISAYEQERDRLASAQKQAADEARLQAWSAEQSKRVEVDKFPHLSKVERWQEEVLDVVVQHFNDQQGVEQKQVLDFVEAARLLEEHYEEQAVLDRYRADKKSKLAKAAAAADPDGQAGSPDLEGEGDGQGDATNASPAEERPGTKLEAARPNGSAPVAPAWNPSRPTERYVGDAPSLSNRNTSAPAAGTAPPDALLSKEESIRRAARHLRFG